MGFQNCNVNAEIYMNAVKAMSNAVADSMGTVK